MASANALIIPVSRSSLLSLLRPQSFEVLLPVTHSLSVLYEPSSRGSHGRPSHLMASRKQLCTFLGSAVIAILNISSLAALVSAHSPRAHFEQCSFLNQNYLTKADTSNPLRPDQLLVCLSSPTLCRTKLAYRTKLVYQTNSNHMLQLKAALQTSSKLSPVLD